MNVSAYGLELAGEAGGSEAWPESAWDAHLATDCLSLLMVIQMGPINHS